MAERAVQEVFRRVLIVEDDDAQRWTLSEILTEEGLDVTACDNATEALDYLWRDDIRVVVLDLQLPDLTGVQLLNRLGDRADHISIIINTGHFSYESAKEALNLGAFAYVEKAGDPEELLRHVHRAVAFQLRRHAAQLEATVAESADELKAANRALRQEVVERKEAEAAVRESETRFRELVELLPQTVLETDARSHITFVNHFGQDSFGCDPHELVQRDIAELFAPEDRRRIRRNVQKRLDGERFEDHEYLAVRADGTSFPVLLYSSPILRGGAPVGLRCIAVDITDRKQAETALRDSLQTSTEIVSSIPSGLFIYQYEPPETLTLVTANPAAGRLTGLDPSEHIGRPFDEIWPEAKGTGLTDHYLDVMRTGHTFRTEEFVYHDNRVDGVFSIRAFRIAGDRLGVAFENVTERRKAELALRESERKLSTLMANLPGMAYRCLVDDEWTMLFVSQGCTVLTGYDCADVTDSRTISYNEIIHPDDRPHVRNEIHKAVAAGIPFQIEYRILTADRQERWVWERGRQVDGRAGDTAILEGFILDVSERKKAEEALRTASTEWQTTFNSLSDVVWLLDSECRIRRCNRATAEVIGLEPDRILGRHCWEVVHKTDGPIEECPILRMQRSHHRESMSFPIGPRWFEITVDPIFGPSHRLEGAVHIMSDITERKEATEELLAYQKKLKAIASELSLTEERERRRIAVDLHDHACQSLALSKMRLQDLIEQANPVSTQELQSICTTLNTTIESVRELTFDLSSPTLYKFGLTAALKELLEDKLRGEHHIAYRFSDDRKAKPLPQDVLVLLFQSVRELLINVIKHARAREVALDIRREIDCIRITVADDGMGFDVDEVLSSPARGRSVGLFNIRERLDYIGGTLDVHSEPGHGSRFVLAAPLKTEQPATKESHDGGENSAR